VPLRNYTFTLIALADAFCFCYKQRLEQQQAGELTSITFAYDKANKDAAVRRVSESSDCTTKLILAGAGSRDHNGRFSLTQDI